MRRRVKDSVDAFLRNNNSTIRRISPEKMRNVLKNNLNKCPRISPKKGQKSQKTCTRKCPKTAYFCSQFFENGHYMDG